MENLLKCRLGTLRKNTVNKFLSLNYIYIKNTSVNACVQFGAK